MSSTSLKHQLQEEIELIPEENLLDVYNFIHYFRLGAEKKITPNKEGILAFAGCWQDMDELTFQEMMSDIGQRRADASLARRANEGCID